MKSDLVVSAFYVVAAANIDAAVQIAKLHPATRDGGVEVRPLFVPAGKVQDDYADQREPPPSGSGVSQSA